MSFINLVNFINIFTFKIKIKEDKHLKFIKIFVIEDLLYLMKLRIK